MRLKIGAGPLVLAILVLMLVTACGSDDSEEIDEALEKVSSDLLYRSALAEVQSRNRETGEYIYLPEDVNVLEQALEADPGHLSSKEVLAWIYSTYPEYVGDTSVNELALEYGLDVFIAWGQKDVHMYQILGAAMYKNGHLILGDQLFDGAIEKAGSPELSQYFREGKERVRGLYTNLN